MKILLSAYACEPNKASEQDVGFQALIMLAEHHDVWLLTKQNNVAPLESYLKSNPPARKVQIHGLDLTGLTLRLKRKGLLGLNWYYHRWQQAAARICVSVDRDVDFDVIYHVTFASYWTSVGAAFVNKPLLLGPIGGAVEAPLRLLTELGWRGVVEELFRSLGRRLWSRLPSVAHAHRRASRIFVNNEETAHRLKQRATAAISVLPNPTAVKVPDSLPARIPSHDIAFVGRLIPWKGAQLALRCFRYVETPDARLLIFGDGPDRLRIEKRITRWGLKEKVFLMGHVPRGELLDQLSRCGAMLHPAFHEEGGNAVAEALAMHVPVVCLNRGGPPITLALFPGVKSRAINPRGPTRTARDMAKALDETLQTGQIRGQSTIRPQLNFQEQVLGALESVGRGLTLGPS